MGFLKTITDSIYSPRFYQNLLTRSFKQSIGYFLLLALILTVINLITISGSLLIEVPTQIEKFGQGILNCYPKDLEIKIINGQVSMNQPEPYFIPSCGIASLNQNMAVIDTQTPFSATKLDEYKTLVWITKDSVVYRENNFETRSYSLAQIKDFNLNKAVLNSYYSQISPWFKFIGPILALFVFIGIYLSFSFKLIYLLILAVIIWLLSKAFKKNLTYRQSYKVLLYAVTLGFIAELVISLSERFTNFHGFPFMFTIITLGIVTINLFVPKKQGET